MSLFSSQKEKHHPTNNHKKKKLSQDQIRLLEESFDGNKKLEPERKLHLARELGVPPRQIAIWYQNKRARWKNQSLEVDYNAIQARLEGALEEKRQLEKEVKHLQEELQKAKDVLIGYNQAQAYPQVASLSSCCDDGGGSTSLYDDVSCSWGNGDQNLQFNDQFFPYFLGDGSNCGSRWQNDCVGFGIINTRNF